MTEVSKILAIIYNFMEDNSIEDEALSYIQFAIRNVENHAWPVMRAVSDVTSTSEGIIIPPARCREIIHVTSAQTTESIPSYEFLPLDVVPSAEYIRQNKYWIAPHVGLDADEATYTVDVTQGSITITQVSGKDFFTSEDVGKSITLLGSSQEYEILTYTGDTLDTITVAPDVSIATSANATATLRYAGRPRYKLYTNYLLPFEGDVTITYQKTHPEVWGESSKLLLSCFQSVAYLAIQMFQQTNKYDVDAERLQRKLDLAMAQEIGGAFFSKKKKPTGDSMFAVHSRRNYNARKYPSGSSS